MHVLAWKGFNLATIYKHGNVILMQMDTDCLLKQNGNMPAGQEPKQLSSLGIVRQNWGAMPGLTKTPAGNLSP
jgi:hypothetical protein